MTQVDKKNITIEKLINSNDIKYKTWYWFNKTQDNAERRTIEMFNKDAPLLRLHDSTILNNEEINSPHEIKKYWDGIMFACIDTDNGQKNVIYRLIHLYHNINEVQKYEWDKIINSIKKTSDISQRADGMYYFKKYSEGKFQEVQAVDTAFLRSYYALSIITDTEQHKKMKLFNINTMVTDYSIYEYYSSGRTKLFCRIMAGIDKNDNIKSYYLHSYPFEDEERNRILYMGKSTHVPGETITKITDKKSPYWLQNILSD